MSEEVKAVHREPHPFIGIKQLPNFIGKPIAFVAKVERFEENTMIMKTAEGKSLGCLFQMGAKMRYKAAT